MTAVAPPDAPPTERRVATRRQPALGTVCRFDDPDAAGGAAFGLLWNISRTGVSMLMSAAPDAGAELTGLLETVEDEHLRPVGLRVVHVKPIATGDYLVGAAFAEPLTADELRPFVA